MDWSQHSIPAMRLEARFGDRLVPAFCDRPGNIWAMVAAAADRNPDGEALICGARRMNWREVTQQSARIAAADDVCGGSCGAGDGAAVDASAKARDRLCADRLRRETPDP
jgi:hypothetical protein